MTASIAQLGAGFILQSSPLRAGRPRPAQRHADKPYGLPLRVCTRHFSKQLDSDRQAAYVPPTAFMNASTPAQESPLDPLALGTLDREFVDFFSFLKGCGLVHAGAAAGAEQAAGARWSSAGARCVSFGSRQYFVRTVSLAGTRAAR